jgi:hypothetical protein
MRMPEPKEFRQLRPRRATPLAPKFGPFDSKFGQGLLVEHPAPVVRRCNFPLFRFKRDWTLLSGSVPLPECPVLRVARLDRDVNLRQSESNNQSDSTTAGAACPEVRERPDFGRLISYIALPAACCRFRLCLAACCRFRLCLVHAAARVVWSCVASCVWRLCRVAHGCRGQCFAHTAGCPLPAARRTRTAAVPCVSCCITHVLASSCMPSAVCCTLFVACCPLPVVRCRPHVALLSLALLHVCCPVHAVCCLFRVVYTKSGFCCMLHVARFPVHVVCCVACRCCSLHVA